MAKIRILKKCWWTGNHKLTSYLIKHVKDVEPFYIHKCLSCGKIEFEFKAEPVIMKDKKIPTNIEIAEKHEAFTEEPQPVLDAMEEAQKVAIEAVLESSKLFLMSSVMCPPSAIREKVYAKLNLKKDEKR